MLAGDVTVPGSVANLGGGFDTLGVAVQLYLRARIVDVAPESLIVEITGTEEKIDGLVEMLRPFGVIEMARTGRLSMARGRPSGRAEAAEGTEHGGASDESVACSV